MVVPEFEHAAQDADLRLLGLGQHLEHVVELGDGCERVREALHSQLQQRLHKHVDLQRVVAGQVALIHRARVGQLRQFVQHVLWGATLSDRVGDGTRCVGSGQGT